MNVANRDQSQLHDVLIELLVCPIDKGSLLYIANESVLYNPRLKKSYKIQDSIPVMLIEQAYDVDDETHLFYIKSDSIETGTVKDS